MYLDISRLAKIADSVDAMNLDKYGSNPENVASVDRPLDGPTILKPSVLRLGNSWAYYSVRLPTTPTHKL